jgi:predicted RNase H-like HicB family nuclease
MGNYIAIAEPALDSRSWWITFPALPGVTAVANTPGQIPRKAREALAAAVEAGTQLPPSLDEGGVTSYDLNDYRKPLVLLVSVDRASE